MKLHISHVSDRKRPAIAVNVVTIAALFLTIQILLVPAPAAALESVDFHAGLLYIGNPTYEPASIDGLPTGGPSPLVNAYSFSLPFELGAYFRFASR